MHKILNVLFISTSCIFSQSISFDEVLKQTLKNHKDLKKQEMDIKLSKLDIDSINSISYGKLNLKEEISNTNHSGYVFNSKLSSREASFKDFGFSQMNEGINTQAKDLNFPKNRTNFNTKITYDLPLFTGYKLTNQKDILKLQKKANEVKYLLNKNEVSYEVLKAYNNAVIAKKLIKVTEEAKKAIILILKSAIAFHKEGLVTKIDVKQAKVYKLNINSKLIEAKNRFSLAISYLKFLTSNKDINDIKSLKNLNTKMINQNKLYDFALKKRSELKMQNINIQAMKKNIQMSNSSYLPEIYAHLEYGFNNDVLKLNKKQDYYIAMVGINYTLFDNNRSINKQKKQIEYKKAKLDYLKLKDSIKLQLESSLLNLRTKEKIMEEKKEAKNLANEIFKQSKLMYKNHLISITNLIEQEAKLRKSEVDFIIAKHEKILAKAELLLNLGKDITKDNN